jgi:hypothetical protein
MPESQFNKYISNKVIKKTYAQNPERWSIIFIIYKIGDLFILHSNRIGTLDFPSRNIVVPKENRLI